MLHFQWLSFCNSDRSTIQHFEFIADMSSAMGDGAMLLALYEFIFQVDYDLDGFYHFIFVLISHIRRLLIALHFHSLSYYHLLFFISQHNLYVILSTHLD